MKWKDVGSLVCCTTNADSIIPSVDANLTVNFIITKITKH